MANTTDPRIIRKFGPGGHRDRIDPCECRHLDCEAEAIFTAITPFGTGNFCVAHAEEIERMDHSWTEWLIACFRYGPGQDPAF
jgi:hypothetical protein